MKHDRALDDRILALYRSNKRALEIAQTLGVTEPRVLHELNRILNERNAWRFAAQQEMKL